MNVYLTSTVKFNLVKFHSNTSTQTPHSKPLCSAIGQAYTCLKDTWTNRALINALTLD